MNTFISKLTKQVLPEQNDVFKSVTKLEAEKIHKKYPDRVPVIVKKCPSASDTPEIDKHKYLVPKDLTVGQFQYVIRKRLKLSPEMALFIFVNNIVPPTSMLISTIYEDAHDENTKFLFITYSLENTFG